MTRKELPSARLVLLVVLVSSHCGGRMIDTLIRPDDGGASTTSTASTTSSTRSSSSTGFDVSSSIATTGSSTFVATGSGGVATSSSVTTTGFGVGGTVGAGGASSGSGSGGFAGYAGMPQGGAPLDGTVVCESAPIPRSDQSIVCKKIVRDAVWSCSCFRNGMASSCNIAADMPCGATNCCGFDTRAAVGCPATPVTIPPFPYCASQIKSGSPACSHVNHVNSQGYGPFTSCCPPSEPFSCPNGTPQSCFASVAAARMSCGDYCVQCVPQPNAPPP